jgi:branched-subunit amino acid transport protein AzlD
MSTGKIWIVILISAAITFLLRALPFLLFRGNKTMPERLVYLGKILPSAIMAVLIVYCLKDIGSDWTGIGIPRLIAVGIVALSYKWKHNTLLSILGGTASYMILLHIF